jgi:hypothetical protein
MHPNEIYAYIRRQPFRPLRIHLTDGATYEVHHPELALLTIFDLHIAIPQKLGDVPERSVHIARQHVTHIEPLEIPQQTARDDR